MPRRKAEIIDLKMLEVIRSFSFLPAHVLMSLNSIGMSSADRVHTKSKFSLIVIDVYYVYCSLIILCAKNVSLVILFGR